MLHLPCVQGRLCDNLLAANSSTQTPSPDQAGPGVASAWGTLSQQPADVPLSSTSAQHTLHNCVLLANRFSTYETRTMGLPGPEGASGFGRPARSKRGKRGGGVGQEEGKQDGFPCEWGGGLEAMLARNQPVTMLSLMAAGACGCGSGAAKACRCARACRARSLKESLSKSCTELGSVPPYRCMPLFACFSFSLL